MFTISDRTGSVTKAGISKSVYCEIAVLAEAFADSQELPSSPDVRRLGEVGTEATM